MAPCHHRRIRLNLVSSWNRQGYPQRNIMGVNRHVTLRIAPIQFTDIAKHGHASHNCVVNLKHVRPCISREIAPYHVVGNAIRIPRLYIGSTPACVRNISGLQPLLFRFAIRMLQGQPIANCGSFAIELHSANRGDFDWLALLEFLQVPNQPFVLLSKR